MKQVCILVEGQTEEAVVKTLLIDAAKARDIYLIPIIVRTSLTPAGVSRGGGHDLLSENTIEHLIRAIDDAGGPEKINNGEKTSPSKRLLALEPEYGKTSTGISILREVGLAAVLDRCPVFAAWWRTLLSH